MSISIGFLFGCNLKKTQIVARVGNSLISVEQFEREFLESNTIQSAQSSTLQDKKKFLDRIIENRTKLLFARQMGIDKLPEVEEQIEQAKQRSSYTATLEKQVMFKIIKEEEIKKFYDRSDKEIRVRHILLDLPPKEDIDSLHHVIQKATDIIEQLRSGGDFNSLVEKFSKDEFTIKKGGNLGFLKWGSMDNVFMAAALRSAKHQIYPQPIITSKGVHIIQVTDRRKILQKPYEFEKGTIVRYLFNKKRKEVMAEFEKFNVELDKKHNIFYLDDNLQKALGFITSKPNDSLLIANYQVKNPDYSWISYELQSLPLVKYDYEIVTLVDFFNLIFNQPNSPRPGEITSVEVMKNTLQNNIRYDLTAEIGFKSGYLDIPNYRRQLDRQSSQILIRYLQNNHINKLLPITDEMSVEFYNKQPEKYQLPAKAEVQEIYVKDSTEAQLVYQRAVSGENFNELVEKYNTRARTKNKNGNLGFVTENSYGELSKVAIKIEIGKITGPLKFNNGYSIFRVLSREKEQAQSYDKVKLKVRSDLAKELKQQKKEMWEGKIRNLYRIRIYSEILELALN